MDGAEEMKAHVQERGHKSAVVVGVMQDGLTRG